MKPELTFMQKLTLFFKGLLMGAANKIPGVSGGTVSFVLGFYEELIYSFQKINFKALKLLISGRFKSFFAYINAPFLISVILGVLFSYFSISLVLDFLIKNYEVYVWSWFFGIIIGSVYYIFKNFGNWSAKSVIWLIIGASIGLSISFMTPAKQNDNLWFVFVCGIIGVSGMTLPGLSGSFILILLGNYVLLLVDSVNALFEVVKNLVLGNFEIIKDPIKIKYLKIIAVFSAGSVFGLVSISHILGYVLKRWNQIVNAIIIGFIVGSLGIVWPWKETIYKSENGVFYTDQEGNKIVENYQRFIPDFSNLETWVAVFCIIMGVVLILAIDFYEKKRKK